MTQQKRPLTLRDVSEASGVSEMTVSRVLRNRGDVSAATRAKVLSATKVLGYVPCGGETAADVLGSTYEIDVAGMRVSAEVSLKSMYDPLGARAKL